MMQVIMGIFLESFGRLHQILFSEKKAIIRKIALLSLKSKIIDIKLRRPIFFPGMKAQVDIMRGRRTILEYFWQPVAKTTDIEFKG